ncbi:MAG: hypothetical protein LBT82_00460 [Oscillospiraceae bacterium]|jgi:hypothetical protein|nr:hypothetical protein [Oscillospiraceae bacterium]
MKKNFKTKRKLTVAKRLTLALVASTVLITGLTTTSHAVYDKKTLKVEKKFNNNKMQQLAYEKEKINKKMEEEKRKFNKLENKILNILENLEQSSNEYSKKEIKNLKNNYKKSSNLQENLKNIDTIINLFKKDHNNLNCSLEILTDLISYNMGPEGKLNLGFYSVSNLIKFISDTLEKLKNFPDDMQEKAQTREYFIIMLKCSILHIKKLESNNQQYINEFIKNFNKGKYPFISKTSNNNYSDFKINNIAGFIEAVLKHIEKIKKSQKEMQETITQINFLKELLEKKVICLQNLEKLEKELKKNQKELDEIINQKDKLESLPYSDQKFSDSKKVNLKVEKQQNDSNKNVDDCKVVQNQKEKNLDINNSKKIEDKKYNTVPCKINGRDGNKGPSSKSKPKTGVNSENWSFLAASFLSVAAIGLFFSKFFFKKRKLDEISN